MCLINDQREVQIQIKFGRQIIGYLLTTFLPTLIAVLTGHLTTYFPDDRFDTVINVDLTLLLVLTTM
jgi:hypothetical protein